MVKYDLARKAWMAPLLFTPLFSPHLSVQAQTHPPACDPPAADTYLLFIQETSQAAQDRLRLALPDSIDPQICQYLNQAVIRLGAFTDLKTADRWGQYLQEMTGLATVVATPPTSEAASTVQPFTPHPLDPGYAVLVNYFNEPETAAQLRDTLDKDIGLVSYLARPYLLALHTESETEANRVLQQLSQQGFWAVVVNGDRATLLTPTVAY